MWSFPSGAVASRHVLKGDHVVLWEAGHHPIVRRMFLHIAAVLADEARGRLEFDTHSNPSDLEFRPVHVGMRGVMLANIGYFLDTLPGFLR
jgi:hypothetical protein